MLRNAPNSSKKVREKRAAGGGAEDEARECLRQSGNGDEGRSQPGKANEQQSKWRD